MDWMKYLKYAAGVGLVIAGVYVMFTGDFDKGIELIAWGLALLGFSATADIYVAQQKRIE